MRSSRIRSGTSRPRPRPRDRYSGGIGNILSDARTDPTNDDDDNYDVERRVRRGYYPMSLPNCQCLNPSHPQMQILKSILTPTLHGNKSLCVPTHQLNALLQPSVVAQGVNSLAPT